jgi:succinate dehydrogenase flavin-adding protein (antitoxin of CptAB toxin-antitoxin module)
MRRREVLYDSVTQGYRIIAKDENDRVWFVERSASVLTEEEAQEFAQFLEWRDRDDA